MTWQEIFWIYQLILMYLTNLSEILLLSTKSKPLLKQCFWSMSLTVKASSVFSTSRQTNHNCRKPNLFFLSLSISLTRASNFCTLVMVFIPLIHSICSWMDQQNIWLPTNTCFNVITNILSFCTRICLDINMVFIGYSVKSYV